MTRLTPDFQFSQGSLQDYADCPRRFQLRYLDRLAWPALEVAPAMENERHLRQGVAFHRLVRQHLLGLAPERLLRAATAQDLDRWWQNYMAHPPAVLPPRRSPEIVLSAPMGGHRLLAKYDLIAVEPGRRAVIWDWKTTRGRPQRKWLEERLQTKVYRFLLVQAGSQLNDGHAFEPEQVEMGYWFACFPSGPELFHYDALQYAADELYLSSLIEEIKRLGAADFSLTEDHQHCDYCRYRSLCQRGVTAGSMPQTEEDGELEDDLDFVLDHEQIAEVEY
jgi:hypothetical protein